MIAFLKRRWVLLSCAVIATVLVYWFRRPVAPPSVVDSHTPSIPTNAPPPPEAPIASKPARPVYKEIEIARVAIHYGQVSKGEALLRAALVRLEAERVESSDATLALWKVAEEFATMGRLEDAAEIYRRTIAREGGTPGTISISERLLAGVLRRQGKQDAAEEISQRADHRLTGTTFNDLTTELMVYFTDDLLKLGKEAEAIITLRRIVESYERRGSTGEYGYKMAKRALEKLEK